MKKLKEKDLIQQGINVFVIVGNTTETTRTSLIKGHSKSCGCLSKELFINRSKKYNKYSEKKDYIIGYASNTNNIFFVDTEDFKKIEKYCWHETNNGYIATRKDNKIIYLHKLITNSTYEIIDHINRNKKDCRKSNLRIVTAQQNSINKGMQSNNRSGVPGVYFDKARRKWVAKIEFNKKTYMKRFEDKKQAIICRKEWETKFFQQYAPMEQ